MVTAALLVLLINHVQKFLKFFSKNYWLLLASLHTRLDKLHNLVLMKSCTFRCFRKWFIWSFISIILTWQLYCCLFSNAQYHIFWIQHLRVVWKLHLYDVSGRPTTIIYAVTKFLQNFSWHTQFSTISNLWTNFIVCIIFIIPI